ncbi:hypothetical protein BH18VER1_BH18VER1_16020 [soil metagenome]
MGVTVRAFEVHCGALPDWVPERIPSPSFSQLGMACVSGERALREFCTLQDATKNMLGHRKQ